jgi:transcription initiation factor IIE alpha subunit
MARVRKTKSSKRDTYAGGFADAVEEADEDADLPKDEAGRRKIKRQYQDLLGIRIEKLKGRILNRERINKTIEGIYFICSKCMKVCHSLDEGLQEDPDNQNNQCSKCAKARPAAA